MSKGRGGEERFKRMVARVVSTSESTFSKPSDVDPAERAGASRRASTRPSSPSDSVCDGIWGGAGVEALGAGADSPLFTWTPGRLRSCPLPRLVIPRILKS